MEKQSKNRNSEGMWILLVLSAFGCVFVFALYFMLTQYDRDMNDYRYKCYLSYLSQMESKFDSATYRRFQKSYDFFVQTSETTKSELQKQTRKDKTTVDSLKRALAALQKEDETVNVAPEMYRIKRIWQNSDTQPWTYSAYTAIYLRSSSFHGMFYSRHDVELAIDGKAQYVGDNHLDYVNVVFSDNSFRQFKIKDSPEWILAKEGELVKCEGDKFVPLFKK